MNGKPVVESVIEEPSNETVSASCGVPLRKSVAEALEQYFATLGGHECAGLYDFVMGEVEAPLLEAVMKYAGGNQTKAAQMLGVNRATLRKKLRHHGLG